VADPPKQRPRQSRGFRLSAEALAKVERDARELGITQTQYLETLVLQSGLARTEYFAQQAAVAAFVASGVATALASKVLSRAEAEHIRDMGEQLAGELYGAPLLRPGEVGARNDDRDPRVRALFEAFTGFASGSE
jgi:hypothetical protein